MWSLIYSIVDGSTLQPYVVGRVQGLILKGGHVKMTLMFGGIKLELAANVFGRWMQN